ncbi:hypothetical protein QR685DRAFT_524167, partial [Neurospora intermedia]
MRSYTLKQRKISREFQELCDFVVSAHFCGLRFLGLGPWGCGAALPASRARARSAQVPNGGRGQRGGTVICFF